MAYDVYVQDSWKPTSDLTLELGVRYSLWQPWGTANQAMASFQSQFYDPATAPVIDRARRVYRERRSIQRCRSAG
jgi:outer membrane receptor protein involved in Fe transport